MRGFILSEEGDVVEWLVGALVIALGSIPIIVGLVQAVLAAAGRGESAIRELVRSGYCGAGPGGP